MKRLMITACFGMLLTGQAHGQTAPRSEELPLVISALGSTHTPADKITLTILLRGSGDSDAAAKAQIADKLQRLRTALIAQGVQAGAIAASTPFSQTGFIGNEAFDPNDMPPATGAELPAGMAAANRHATTSVVRVSLTSAAALTRVQQAVADLRLQTYMSPVFELTDDSVARRAAIIDAIRKARADADLYAGAMGYRVIRITQVTNSAPPSRFGMDALILNQMTAAQAGEIRDVETIATATVSFAMTPR